MPLLDLHKKVWVVLPQGRHAAPENRELVAFGVDLDERDPPPDPRYNIVQPAQLHSMRLAAIAGVLAAIAGVPPLPEDPGDVKVRSAGLEGSGAVDHGHREAEPICRGPQEAGEVLQGLDAENVSLRADGPAERECVAADVGLDVDGDRARLDEPWQLVDLPLTVREEAAP